MRMRFAATGCRAIAACCVAIAGIAGGTGAAAAALPSTEVDAATAQLTHGNHRGVTVTASCLSGTLVGGGSYLRNATDPAIVPTNGLVLGGIGPSTGATPVDQPVADGTVDPIHWRAVANYTGVAELGNQATSFALCATGGPARTVVATASTVGPNATQQVAAPTKTVATCPSGTRLIGGGAVTRTPDQLSDGVTVGNTGNLKPLASHPSDAAGVAALDGAEDATSWTAYGSAGITSAVDTVTAFALCSTDPATPPVRVARTDVAGPDAQPGTTLLRAAATCPAGTRLLGGGYGVAQSVGAVDGLQPQQGYHMRGSFPATDASGATEVADGAADPGTWTALVQAGGQSLAAGSRMNIAAYAMCATEAAPPEAADLAVDLDADPEVAVVGDPFTYTATIANAGPAEATDVVATLALPDEATFVSADAAAGMCAESATGVTCELDDLAADASTTVEVAVVPTRPGDLTATATASAAQSDPTPATDTLTTQAILPARAATALTVGARDAVLGDPIVARATLSGGVDATGTISFTLYGPGDVACAAPLTISTATVAGDGEYVAAPYTPTTAGAYRWVVSYGGDGANEPSGPTACDAPEAALAVKAAPALTVAADGATTVGAAISARATLAGAVLAGGTIAFDLYGPGDAACSRPLATSTAAVAGNGIYGSAAFVAEVPGTYRWVARYDGSALNLPAGPTACDDPAAAVAVAAAPSAPDRPAEPGTPPSAEPRPVRIASAKADRRGRIAIGVRAPAAGRLRAVATVRVAVRGRRGVLRTVQFGTRTASVRRGQRLTLTLAPSRRGERLRRAHARLRVTVRLTFTPVGGRPTTRTLRLTVPGARR